MNYLKNFSQAEYQLKEKRQRENRKPVSLPDEGYLHPIGSICASRFRSQMRIIRSSEKGGVNATDIVECPKRERASRDALN